MIRNLRPEQCCSEDGRSFLPESQRHPDCRPIEVAADDPFYAQHEVRCLEFVRSSPAASRDCSLGPRDQMNQITSYLDASSVYGSTDDETDELRLFEDGMLRYTDLHIRKSLLPPLEAHLAKEECRITSRNLHCFHAGDSRVNEQPGLTGLHTVWLREHNRIVEELGEINPHWDDER